MSIPIIEPDWPAPGCVKAFATTRVGGVSAPPYDSFNLAHHVGDLDSSVQANRQRLQECLPEHSRVQWLNQVHGTAVVEALPCDQYPEADGVWTRTPGRVCAVMTADCLPVLLCSQHGEVVAAAHAGWRGLLHGILESAVAGMAVAPEGILAWMGPAIGPEAFEVGGEVRDQFLAHSHNAAGCFVPSPDRPGHFLADLYGLAVQRLNRLGVTQVYGGGLCTVSDPARYFSYRRDGQTGRMASVILLTD